MQVNLLPNCNGVQINGLKCLQQGFRPRGERGTFGISSIQPGQFFLAFGQSTLNDELQQSQHSQANRQQADQAGYSIIILQVHGRQRQRSAFQTGEASFDQVFVPISQNRFRQGQMLCRVVRPIYSPAEMDVCLLDRSFIPADPQGNLSFDAHFRKPISVLAHISFFNLLREAQTQQPYYLVLAYDLFGSLTQGFDLQEVPLALLALIQSFQSRLSLVQSFSQGSFGCFGIHERADKQASLYPDEFFPIHRGGQSFFSFKPFGNFFFFSLSIGAVDRRQSLFTTPHGSQMAFQIFIGDLYFRERPQVIVITGLNVSPIAQRHQLAVANIQQSPFSQPYAYLPDSRNIQGIVGFFSRHYLGGHGHPEGVQDRLHHLHLGQIRP